MLIDGDGNYYGVLGGGCFEGDLVERARKVIGDGDPVLVEYDMRGDEDMIWGLGLGCEGLVRMLLQPLLPGNRYEPMGYLTDAVTRFRPVVLATAFTGDGAGASAILDDRAMQDLGLGPDACSALAEECALRAASGKPGVTELEDGSKVFVDVIPRQHHLLILGAGPDAVPMARLAADLHWRVTVADHRERNPGAAHFPPAVRQIHVEPGRLAEAVHLETVSAVLVMSHHFNADADYLKALATRPPPYIGLLGPTARRVRLLDGLDETGRAAVKDRIRGPVGLDIGGDSPASIALAAIAEIHAVLEGADAAPLDLRRSRSAA